MKLTAIQIKAARPLIKPDGTATDKAYRMTDGKGLYLEVSPTGRKYWRLKYRFGGKEKRIAIGVYPEVSLKDARLKCDHYRQQLADGIDPSQKRKIQKLHTSDENSFEGVAREWHQKQKPSWTKGYADDVVTRLEKNIFPFIGSRNIGEIEPPELLAVLRQMESRGAGYTAKRVRQYCGMVFRYGVAIGKCQRDPSADLKEALVATQTKHHASITDPKEIGGLIRAINGFQGTSIVAHALRLAPYVFVRPTELRHAEWTEIDLENAEWRIPAEKMKKNRVHIVPLSKQSVEILKAIQPLTSTGKYVFPSERTSSRPMSENTINAALRRLGYGKDEMTGHGFRSMASTLLNEQGWNVDVIERQLAHIDGNGVRAAYNYAQHLPERQKMMQAWADYIDGLAGGADVVSIRKNR